MRLASSADKVDRTSAFAASISAANASGATLLATLLATLAAGAAETAGFAAAGFTAAGAGGEIPTRKGVGLYLIHISEPTRPY